MFNTQEFRKDLFWKRAFEKKISKAAAAKEIGISDSTYSRLEQGKLPGVKTLAKCCVWLDMPVYKIFENIDTLDTHKFQKDLAIHRILKNKFSMREAARQIGIDRSTYSRIERGKVPKVDTLAKCIVWLNTQDTKYFQQVKILNADFMNK
jgi:transcriptional regulator with XRE-family HTH domain